MNVSVFLLQISNSVFPSNSSLSRDFCQFSPQDLSAGTLEATELLLNVVRVPFLLKAMSAATS
jgi:hypothetical protein